MVVGVYAEGVFAVCVGASGECGPRRDRRPCARREVSRGAGRRCGVRCSHIEIEDDDCGDDGEEGEEPAGLERDEGGLAVRVAHDGRERAGEQQRGDADGHEPEDDEEGVRAHEAAVDLVVRWGACRV